MSFLIESVWKDFLKIAQEEVGIRVVETWIKAVSFTRYEASHKKIYFSVPNQFIKSWVETHYTLLFETQFRRLLNIHELIILFCVGNCDKPSELISLAPTTLSTELSSALQAAETTINDEKKTGKKRFQIVKKTTWNTISGSVNFLNPDYTFDSFVVGDNNSFAHASTSAIVDKLGTLYNPLLLYSGSGLGKTHLLHAVGNALLAQHPHLSILYQSTDKFVTEFIQAIRFDQVSKFQAKYKKIDVLLLDDIQFMVNKEQTQEAFFHIFNELYDNRKQIILSSDTLPRNLGGLADRLRSRLEWGLLVDIQLPLLETKVAILKRKAELQKVSLSDDVALFIARQTVQSVRELEGLFIRVLAYASLTHQPIEIGLVQKALGHEEDLPQAAINGQNSSDIVIRLMQKHFSCSLELLRSNDRSKAISHIRHIAMFLLKKYTSKSLREIGEYLKRKDHTTIIHAVQKIQLLANSDIAFSVQLKNLERELQELQS